MHDNEQTHKVDFEKIRTTLREAAARNLISDGRYDGYRVTIIGLFTHHGMTTREIALFSGIAEPIIRKTVIDCYNRIINFNNIIEQEK